MIRKILKYFLLVMIFMNGCLSGELNGADKKKVAVLNFEVNDKDVNEKNVLLLTDVLRNVVYEKLSNDDYMLMTQENIVALSEEPLEACIGVTCDVEIGRKLGAQYVITGKIMKIEDEYRLSLKMHDTTSGEMIGSKVIKSDKISKLENEIQGSAGKDLIKKLIYIENEVSDKLEFEMEAEKEAKMYADELTEINNQKDIEEIEEFNKKIISDSFLSKYGLTFDQMVEKRVRPTDENSHNVQNLMNMCRTGISFKFIMNNVKVNIWFTVQEWGNLQSLSDEVLLKFGFNKECIQNIKSFKKSDIFK